MKLQARAQRRTGEGLKRLTAFTDAVVAIALTLLVLPLTDLADDRHPPEQTVWSFLAANSDTLISFGVSFAVIWVMWRHHHRLIEYFATYDDTLVRLHFVWLLTIVVMPFSTALMSSPLRWASTLYIAVLFVSAGILLAMRWWGVRHPDLLEPGASRDEFVAEGIDYTSVGLLAVAMAVSAVWPDSGEEPLLILLLGFPLGALRDRRRAARGDTVGVDG
ncbi:MAG: TMEM175 family protein [Gordonia sp. (in: high G+C Gram-positive bacteria)]|uniref:TMEM175 family protein n=1 Tax=Gordonia sp. (in: high G+C Gram-positive bacteria) TaxID=84139 RepID=UPI0039E61409